jgi:hypothetical protein
MHLLALILGFEGWNFAGDIIMNHIIYFLLLQLDPAEKVKFSNTLINIVVLNSFNFFSQYVTKFFF